MSVSLQFGVPHRVILLEITENNLMKEFQNVIAVSAPPERDWRGYFH
jgi:hypothetical protein